jgi:HEAT repeat protein
VTEKNRVGAPSDHAALWKARQERDVAAVIAVATGDSVEAVIATKYLGEIASEVDRNAIRTLVDLLESPNEHIRANAAQSLSKLQASDAVAPLIAVERRERVPWVRAWMLFALGTLGSRREVQPSLERALRASEWKVRRAAVGAIGEVGEIQDVPVLKEAAQRERLWRHNPYRQAIRSARGRGGSD